MPRRIGIFGATPETLRLLRELMANPLLELSGVWDANPSAALLRAEQAAPEIVPHIEPLITDDLGAFLDNGSFHAVIDSGEAPSFASRFPQAADRGVQILTPLTARLLWAYETATRDRKNELLTALAEVVESVELTIDSEELFGRMLEIAVGVTGAEGGSLMLLDPKTRELSIRVAIGVEPELWPKIRVPLGEGIAGHVAASARPLLLRGKADRSRFQIVRERLDVESALSVPLVSEGGVLGVLNLHHSTREDAFDQDDLVFMERVARLDAQIIARAEEHEALRNQAARYETVRTVQRLLATVSPLPDRLRALCSYAAERVGDGIATVYLLAPDQGGLRLAATSLEGGGFGGEFRVVEGQGIDGQVARSRRPTFLRAEDGSLAYVCLPLLAGEQLVGVLSIQTGHRPPRGRAAEETLLELGAAVAEGIAQAEREIRMSTQANRISAINETGVRMLSSTEVNEVARLATSSAAMVLEADHAVLRLQDPESHRYVIRSYFGSADGQLQEKLFKLDKQACVEAIRRHTTIRVPVLAEDEILAPFAAEFSSLVCAPIRRLGRTIGTLSVYDRVASEHFHASAFDDDDLQIFTKLLTYVERAVDGALYHSQTRQLRNFDEETGLPNAAYVGKRIQEEIARAAGREGALAVTLCRIENLEQISQRVNPAHAHRVTLRTADALRAHLRDFDVLGRTGTAEFTVLLPEPGASPGERVVELSRAVADEVSKQESLNDPLRIALAFGYAEYPSDGRDRDALLARAAEARIRMV
jgi:diguanylate cyclase (GGDEF)-like protein